MPPVLVLIMCYGYGAGIITDYRRATGYPKANLNVFISILCSTIYFLDTRQEKPSSPVDIVKKLPTEPYPVTFRSNTPSPVEHGKHIDKYGEWNFHYEILSMQYTEKNENFQHKFFDIFSHFYSNIHCGYMLEPPRRCGSNAYPQSMF